MLSSLTCSDGTAQASLCEGCPRRCASECVCIKESVCVCVCVCVRCSPPLLCLSGSTIWGVAKALVKWAAGHHSWPANTHTHTHTREGSIEPPGNICIATAQRKHPTPPPEPSLCSPGAEEGTEDFVRVRANCLRTGLTVIRGECVNACLCVYVRLHKWTCSSDTGFILIG